MRIKSSLAVAVAVLTACLAPCAIHALPKPCDLLTAQGASAMLGSPVKPLMQMDVYCGYQSTSENVNVAVSLSSAAGATAATLKALASPGDTSEAIPGLGDSNLLIARGGDSYTLAVIYHGQLVSISVVKRHSPALKAAIVQAVKQMLTKL